MTDRQLMQAILEAMEDLHRTGDTQVFDMFAAPELIPALRERLAQPEQEPVAWMFQHDETGRMSFVSNDGMNNPELFLKMNPRYALVCALVTPPAAQQAGGEVDEKSAKTQCLQGLVAGGEAPAQPAPVQPEHCGPSSSVFGLAEMILSDCGCSSDYQPLLNRVAARIMGYIDTPPEAQREWVGMTDEELGEFDVDPVEAKEMIQRLKEKNNG